MHLIMFSLVSQCGYHEMMLIVALFASLYYRACQREASKPSPQSRAIPQSSKNMNNKQAHPPALLNWILHLSGSWPRRGNIQATCFRHARILYHTPTKASAKNLLIVIEGLQANPTCLALRYPLHYIPHASFLTFSTGHTWLFFFHIKITFRYEQTRATHNS